MLYQQREREHRSESGLSDRYTSRAPIVTGVWRPSYDGYVTEYDVYATLGGLTPTPSSTGMIVKPRTEITTTHGPPIPRDTMNAERAVSTSSHPII